MATETTTAEGAAQATSACVNEHGGAVGLPQLCVDWMPNQIFWLLVTLVVMYLVLSRIALPRIGAVLADRKGTITNDLAAAEELKQKAVEAERAYNNALASARSEAAKIVAAAKAEIQKDLDAATAKADAEIAANKRDFDARFDLAQGLAAAGRWTDAMDELLEILMRDKSWNEDLARKTYIAILDLIERPKAKVADGQIPPDDPVVATYRRRLSSVVLS